MFSLPPPHIVKLLVLKKKKKKRSNARVKTFLQKNLQTVKVVSGYW